MTAQRSRKEEMTYRKYQRARKQAGRHTACVFCDIESGSDQIIDEYKFFYILKNVFPYSVWDGQPVIDHLMIVPKKHTDKLGSLPKGAAEEYLRLLDRYEDKGYNLYARAPGSAIKSVIHQHSHLILPGSSRQRLVFFVKKPFVRITF